MPNWLSLGIESDRVTSNNGRRITPNTTTIGVEKTPNTKDNGASKMTQLPPNDVTAAAHVRLAPSSAYRWSRCPGSAQNGLPDEESAAAAEGTLAHARGSAMLLGVDLAPEFDEALQSLEQDAFDEMNRGIMAYVDYCRGIPGEATYIERKVMSGYIDEHGGTIDYAVDNPAFLHVVDFKYGTMPVPARNNAQLKSYLRLLREYLGRRERYFGTIVQPRVFDLPDTWEFSDADLDDWELTVIEASQDTTLVAGEHCRWCPLLANCETAFNHAKEMAENEFEVIEEVTPILLDRMKAVIEFAAVVTRMEELAKEKMLEYIRYGGVIDGWKAALSRGNRAWRDAEALPEVVMRRMLESGATDFENGDMYQPLALKSPAQLEKVVPKSLIEDLFHRPERGVCVVPRDSKLEEFDFDHFGELPQ